MTFHSHQAGNFLLQHTQSTWYTNSYSVNSGLVENNKIAEVIYSKVNQEYRSCIEVIEELTERKIGYRYPNIVANIEKNVEIAPGRSKIIPTGIALAIPEEFEINEYNKLGISIHYAAFPRSGLQSESYSKIVGAWCSKKPSQTLTTLKQGKNTNLSYCEDSPVEKHYRLGRKIGVTGTPAIISSSGQLIPGYVPADDLLKRLQG